LPANRYRQRIAEAGRADGFAGPRQAEINSRYRDFCAGRIVNINRLPERNRYTQTESSPPGVNRRVVFSNLDPNFSLESMVRDARYF
jgi:hypothetical protein